MIFSSVIRSFLLSLLLFTACATLEPGGSGTETTTGIIGTVVNSQGDPQANVQVQLLPEAYNPVRDTIIIPIDTTDSLGRYSFMQIFSGNYTVQAVHISNRTRAFTSGVLVASDTVITEPDTLRAPGSIKVSLSSAVKNSAGYVYIPGTVIFAYCHDSSDFVMLDSVPAGQINQIAYSSTSQAGPGIIRYEIRVRSNDTTDVWNPLWKHARLIGLNTSETGANIAGNVSNFPILIRLNAGNFDFSQAQSDGTDIRFTKADSAFIDYETERWDPVAKTAEIWVKVDTVYGSDSTQCITMYWGNTASANYSNSAAVFDTMAGFQGVWHFSDDTDNEVRDATVNGYHGLSPDTARPQISSGVAGKCRVFNGIADFVTMPNTANSKLNFPVEGYYTVSAWVALDTLDNAPHLIVAKGYEQYFLRFTYFPSNLPLWEFVEFNETNNWQACTTTAISRQWILLTGVRQGNTQLLYCNGEVVDSTPNIYTTDSYSRNTSNDLSIGKFLEEVNLPNDDGFCFFNGSIDEVRISSAARSPDWMKLCYMNQRADDRLVKFK